MLPLILFSDHLLLLIYFVVTKTYRTENEQIQF